MKRKLPDKFENNLQVSVITKNHIIYTIENVVVDSLLLLNKLQGQQQCIDPDLHKLKDSMRICLRYCIMYNYIYIWEQYFPIFKECIKRENSSMLMHLELQDLFFLALINNQCNFIDIIIGEFKNYYIKDQIFISLMGVNFKNIKITTLDHLFKYENILDITTLSNQCLDDNRIDIIEWLNNKNSSHKGNMFKPIIFDLSVDHLNQL